MILRELAVSILFRDRASNPLSRVNRITNNVVRSVSGLTAPITRASTSMARLGSSGVSSMLKLGAAVTSTIGGFKLLKETIGQAAQFEQSSVLIDAMFDDKKASKAYINMMQNLAAKSPILNSQDMLANSKSFIMLSKNSKVLEKAWKNVEKLNVLDPVQGVEGAVLALKELAGGDSQSLVERFEFSRKDVNAIKNLPFDKQVDAVSKLLAKMNMTDKVINKMGNTTSAQWSRFKETGSIALTKIGSTANSEIGKALKRINDLVSSKRFSKFAVIGDMVLGKTIGGIVSGFEFLIKAVGKARSYLKGFSGVFSQLKSNAVKIGIAYKGAFEIFTGNKDGGMNLLEKAGLSPSMANGVVSWAKIVKSSFASVVSLVQGQIPVWRNLGTILGKTFASAANVIAPVFNTIKNLSQSIFANAMPQMSSLFNVLPEAFSSVLNSISPVTSIISSLGSGINKLVNNFVIPLIPVVSQFINSAFKSIQPALQTVKGLFSTVANVVRALVNNVVIPLIPVAKSIIQTAFKIITPILRIASSLFKVIGSVIKYLVNNIVVPLIPLISSTIKVMWKIAKPILNGIATVFNGIADAIEWAIKKFGSFVSTVKNTKIGLPKWMGGKGLVQVPGHATGLSRVPYDNYLARLHKNEAVLTAQQSQALRNAGILKNNGGKPTIDFNDSSASPLSAAQPSGFGGSIHYNPVININVSGSNAGTSDVKRAVQEVLDDHYKFLSNVFGIEVAY